MNINVEIIPATGPNDPATHKVIIEGLYGIEVEDFIKALSGTNMALTQKIATRVRHQYKEAHKEAPAKMTVEQAIKMDKSFRVEEHDFEFQWHVIGQESGYSYASFSNWSAASQRAGEMDGLTDMGRLLMYQGKDRNTAKSICGN